MSRSLCHVNACVANIREYKLASHEVWHVPADERCHYAKLDWNESVAAPSPRVIQAVKRLATDGSFYNLYPAVQNERLMHALSEYAGLPEEYIQYFASSDSLQEYICRTYLDVHSRVLILSPSYDNFRLTAESCGAEVIYADMRSNFTVDYDLFEQDIRNYHPQMVYICNPNNPTGTQHSMEYIRHLAESFPRSLFLIDEAYWEFSGITVKELAREHENLLICRTFSKAFGLANFRIGYLIASPYHIGLINKIRNPKNITTFAQEAALAALSDTGYMQDYVKAAVQGREYLFQELQKLDRLGTAYQSMGNFVMFQFYDEKTKAMAAEYLRNTGIFVRELTQRPSVLSCIRISAGTKELMVKTAEAFRAFERRYCTDCAGKGKG